MPREITLYLPHEVAGLQAAGLWPSHDRHSQSSHLQGHHTSKENPNWPNQPRVPAGQPDGGQWTDGGGGGGQPSSQLVGPRRTLPTRGKLPGNTVSPVPNPQLRQRDTHGSGSFGARRGQRLHDGIDIVAKPGDKIFSPVDGVYVRVVRPYSDPKWGKFFTGALILSDDGFYIRIFYINTSKLREGQRISAGGMLGELQDLRERYEGITPHIHLDIQKPPYSHLGPFIDPTPLLREWQSR